MSYRSLICGASLVALVGCGGSDSNDGAGGSAGAGGSGGAAGSATGGAAGNATGGAAGNASGGAAGNASGGAAGNASGGSTGLDPRQDGPFSTTTVDATTQVVATGHNVPMHCVVPSTGPASAPYPLVLVLHGFQLAPAQYDSYANRLASYGYVACTADYPATLFNVSHAAAAKDAAGALDWAIQSSETVGGQLAGKVDKEKVGVMGHSLGGKVSVLAASDDARFKAVLGLDPVDTVPPTCNATQCPDASQKLPLSIPTAFLGETLDATGGFQACAPAADNFQTFYAAASSPSLEVTLAGANHMSFVDDLASASACGIARAYTVAFFERHLRGNTAYDAWLTGADAKQAFVDSGKVTLQSK